MLEYSIPLDCCFGRDKIKRHLNEDNLISPLFWDRNDNFRNGSFQYCLQSLGHIFTQHTKSMLDQDLRISMWDFNEIFSFECASSYFLGLNYSIIQVSTGFKFLSLWLPLFIFNFICNILYLGNLMCFYMPFYQVCLNMSNLSPNHFRVFMCMIYDLYTCILCVFLVYKDRSGKHFWIFKWLFGEHFLRNYDN